MTPLFKQCVEIILLLEGVYSSDPSDPGNWTGKEVGKGDFRGTKFGISAASYPHIDIKNLTRDAAIGIYHLDYWQPLNVENADAALALCAFDCAVNQGVNRAKDILAYTKDGFDFLSRRIREYTGLETFNRYGKGWMNRLSTISYHMGVLKKSQKLKREVLVLNVEKMQPVVVRGNLVVGDDGRKIDVRAE